MADGTGGLARAARPGRAHAGEAAGADAPRRRRRRGLGGRGALLFAATPLPWPAKVGRGLDHLSVVDDGLPVEVDVGMMRFELAKHFRIERVAADANPARTPEDIENPRALTSALAVPVHQIRGFVPALVAITRRTARALQLRVSLLGASSGAGAAPDDRLPRRLAGRAVRAAGRAEAGRRTRLGDAVSSRAGGVCLAVRAPLSPRTRRSLASGMHRRRVGCRTHSSRYLQACTDVRGIVL